jgi:type VI protein secretion system component VasF
MPRSSARSADTPKSKRKGSAGKPAKSAALAGVKVRKRSKSSVPASYDVNDLVAAVTPLLELFAMLDAVFTEDDALTINRRVSLGRCYEAWQTCRKAFDPDFVSAEARRPKKWKYDPEA